MTRYILQNTHLKTHTSGDCQGEREDGMGKKSKAYAMPEGSWRRFHSCTQPPPKQPRSEVE